MSASSDTVVFDIGNVLLDWDPRHLYRTIFPDPAEMERFLASVCTGAWNLAQDAGRSWADGEAEAIGRQPGYANEIRAFRARWHEMIPGPIAGTVTILETLAAAGVPLYAITNFASDTFRETVERFAFLRTFAGIVVSGDERILKPDPAIYRRLTERWAVDLHRAVFIDDSTRNVEGARAVGMRAIHFTTPRDLARALGELGFPLPAEARATR